MTHPYSSCLNILNLRPQGESRVVAKKAGDLVYGGSVVVEGSALMIVTACGSKRFVSKVLWLCLRRTALCYGVPREMVTSIGRPTCLYLVGRGVAITTHTLGFWNLPFNS